MIKRKKSERKKIKKKGKSVENVKRKKSNLNLAPILIIKWPNFSSCQNPFKLGHFLFSSIFSPPVQHSNTHCSSSFQCQENISLEWLKANQKAAGRQLNLQKPSQQKQLKRLTKNQNRHQKLKFSQIQVQKKIKNRNQM